MKKCLLLFLLSTMLLTGAVGQIPLQEITWLKRQLYAAGSDSARIQIFLELSNGYRFSNIDSALSDTEKAIELSRRIAQPVLEGYAISQKGYILLEAGEIPDALQSQFISLSIAEQARDLYLEASSLNRIGNTYMELGDSVSTKKADNKILISVKDNGNGILQNVLDKIFQPFFTTKPTGKGTGLGLSLKL